jgi:hypothetical protein
MNDPYRAPRLFVFIVVLLTVLSLLGLVVAAYVRVLITGR